MSWQDRDYAHQPGGVGAPPPRLGAFRARFGGSMVTKLIVINVVVFIACQMTGGFPRAGILRGADGAGRIVHVGGSPLYRWGFLTAPLVLQGGQVWRIVTCTFLHVNFMHILMNMIGLFFLGPPVEQRWGPRMTLGVYLICGVLANCFYLALAGSGYFGMQGVSLVGASGCVLALLGAAAVMFPNAVLYVYGIIPLKIRTAAILFGVMYLWNLKTRGRNAGGDACHLVGMIGGAWWAWRGYHWWDMGGRAAWERLVARLPMARGRSRAARAARPARTFRQHIEQREVDQALVDRILKKVHDGGLHSLTEAEKQALKDVTRRLQARDTTVRGAQRW